MEEVWDTQQWAVAYEGFCGDTARGMGKDVDCGGQQISDVPALMPHRQWDNNNQQMGDCWDFYSHQWSWNSRKLAQFYGAEYRAIWFVLDLKSIYLSNIGISTIFDKIDIHFA